MKHYWTFKGKKMEIDSSEMRLFVGIYRTLSLKMTLPAQSLCHVRDHNIRASPVWFHLITFHWIWFDFPKKISIISLFSRNSILNGNELQLLITTEIVTWLLHLISISLAYWCITGYRLPRLTTAITAIELVNTHTQCRNLSKVMTSYQWLANSISIFFFKFNSFKWINK